MQKNLRVTKCLAYFERAFWPLCAAFFIRPYQTVGATKTAPPAHRQNAPKNTNYADTKRPTNQLVRTTPHETTATDNHLKCGDKYARSLAKIGKYQPLTQPQVA